MPNQKIKYKKVPDLSKGFSLLGIEGGNLFKNYVRPVDFGKNGYKVFDGSPMVAQDPSVTNVYNHDESGVEALDRDGNLGIVSDNPEIADIFKGLK